MFDIYNESTQLNPIKVWLEDVSQLDDVCYKQAINLSNLPNVFKWIALMPDTHQGYGMPIGGVLAVKGNVIPNAVGVDIGCGVIFLETDLDRKKLKDHKVKTIIHDIMERIPVGFKHQTERQDSNRLDQLIANNSEFYEKNGRLFKEIEASYSQLGTLGSGNHFIEIQEDENGKLCVMIHSGSRNFGLKIAQYFDEKAKLHVKKVGDKKSSKSNLSYLPADSESGMQYIRWMNLALEFAKENRYKMMEVVKDVLLEEFPSIDFVNEINAHHNYVAMEEHYGEAVWVHRKGAIRVVDNELGIIPGAMGSYSYIVKGKGNPESFYSCSHGAGRHISRKQAMKKFSKEKVLQELKDDGVFIGTPSKSILSDESKHAYKDINYVMSQQKDLVDIVKTLKSVIVIKG